VFFGYPPEMTVMLSSARRLLLALLSGVVSCAGQVISFTPGNPGFNWQSNDFLTPQVIATVTTSPPGLPVSVQISAADQWWIAFDSGSGDCSQPTLTISVPLSGNLSVCITNNTIVSGYYYVFAIATTGSTSISVGLPLTVNPTGTVAVTPTHVDVSLGNQPATVSVANTDSSPQLGPPTIAYAEASAGKWLNEQDNCATNTACYINVGAITSQLVAPVSGRTYHAKVTVRSGSGNQADLLVSYTYQAGPSAPTQVFPHIAAEPGWQTELFIMNPGNSTVTFSVVLHPDSNTILLENNPPLTNLSLPPHGSLFLRTAATRLISGGWAEIDSSAALSGVAVFRELASDGKDYEGSVLLSAPVSGFVVPVDETLFAPGTPQVNGLAVTNTDPTRPTQITCSAYDGNGNKLILSTPNVSLNASQHTAFTFDTQFGSALAGQRGLLQCTSNVTKIAAVAIRAAGSAVSSMPVVPTQ
jgi:hypothetical protein